MDIGKRIKELRKSSDLTGNALSQKTGIAQSLISRYENNLIEPPISSLEIICEALGITLSDFFYASPNPIQSQKLAEYTSKLSPEQLEILIQVAKHML